VERAEKKVKKFEGGEEGTKKGDTSGEEGDVGELKGRRYGILLRSAGTRSVAGKGVGY